MYYVRIDIYLKNGNIASYKINGAEKNAYFNVLLLSSVSDHSILNQDIMFRSFIYENSSNFICW